jgi:hypothetical protein
VQSLFNQWRWAALCSAALSVVSVSHGAAQKLLDLPVRVWAGADAVAAGAVAAFWNPAAATALRGRGEIMVVDVLAPEPTGLGGFAVAAAYRLDAATTIALGYHHVGIDGILQTDESPLAEDATPLELGEDGIALAVSRAISPVVNVGILARYIRAAEIAEDRSIGELGVGVHLRPTFPGNPVIGGATRFEADGTAWMAGVEIMPVGTADAEWRLGANWGIDGGPMRIGVSQRVAALAAWREYVAISAGFAGEPDAAGRTWRPVAAATLRFTRYSLAVMREHMANDFGAVHAFRFTVGF